MAVTDQTDQEKKPSVCVNCGKEIPAGSNFCPHCGVPAAQPRETEDPRPSDSPAPRHRDVRRWIAVAVLALVVIAMGCLIGFQVDFQVGFNDATIKTLQTLLWFFILIIIPVFVLCLLFRARNRRKAHVDFVIKNSRALKRIREINARYCFADIPPFSESHTYDNETYYNMISCQDYLIYQLPFKQRLYLQQIAQAKHNKSKFEAYNGEVLGINDFGVFDEPMEKYNRERLCSIETDLFEQERKHPVTEFYVKVTLNCSRINGAIYTGKSEVFYAERICSLISRVNDKQGAFFNDKEIWDALCRVERGRVSNKMRFSIYKRDGYRCRMCGRSGLFHDLEIDHIKPVSKGGKSTYDNLQTLCKRCNQQKGNTYFG